MKFVIEHMDEISEWCILEYTHISEIVGKENLIFTKVNSDKLNGLGIIKKESVHNLKFENVCVLDPEAEKILSPDDKFDYFIFGGILGDFPPRKRTREINIEGERRNLGDVQMSTNTAVYVAKKISEGKKFSDLDFQDDLIIPISDGEEVILPYRFVKENGKLVLPPGYIEMAKKEF